MGDAEGQVAAAGLGDGKILHHGVCQRAVGDCDFNVVIGAKNRVHHRDGLDGAGNIQVGGGDVVARAERLEHEDHQAAGKIRQGALHGQTDGCQAGRQRRNEGRGGDAHDHCHTDEQQCIEQYGGSAAQEGLEPCIQL